jgi:hypothetical protein
MLPSLLLFAAKQHENPEAALISVLLGVVAAVIVLVAAVNKSQNAVWKGGIPRCPRCGKQISFKNSRTHCRSCGHNLVQFPLLSRPLSHKEPQERVILRPLSGWEKLHRDPGDVLAKLSLRNATAKTLTDELMGPKKVDKDLLTGCVVMRRARLQYESRIDVFVDADRHGFEVSVPSHSFKIRITCPRVVPDDVVGAPWDDLLENLCKIDRSIIKSRNSKSQPLSYVPRHGVHPMLRVQVLSRPSKQSPQQLPEA